MKMAAAVDGPAIEPKQRGDLDALVRAGKVDVNEVSRLLQDAAGVARRFRNGNNRRRVPLARTRDVLDVRGDVRDTHRGRPATPALRLGRTPV